MKFPTKILAGRMAVVLILLTALAAVDGVASSDYGRSDGHAVSELMIDDFDLGDTQGVYFQRRNTLGAYQGTYAKRPSYAVITKSAVHRQGDSGRGLTINYHSENGWCGWYTVLDNLDATPYNVLTFWVKGESGRERFDVGLIDQRSHEHQIDATIIGSIDRFLGGNLTTRWTEVNIPLTLIRGEVDLSRLHSLIFAFNYPGSGTIYVDDVRLRSIPDIAKQGYQNMPKALAGSSKPRSMWVWKFDPVVNEDVRDDLFRFCERTAIKSIYLFINNLTTHDEYYFVKLRLFLRQAHDLGLHVEALTGNTEWALSQNHDTALQWVESIIAFNQSAPERFAFDGIAIDIEPHLTSQWNQDRERIKSDFIALLRRIRAAVDRYDNNRFLLSCAIPAFYVDEANDFERRIMELTDYVALMDYYDRADVIIQHALPHLELAEELGIQVVIGVETQDLVKMRQGHRKNTFHEEGWMAMEKELEAVIASIGDRPGFGGIAIHSYYSYRLMPKTQTTPTDVTRMSKPIEDYVQVHTLRRRNAIRIDGNLDDWPDELAATEIRDRHHVVTGAGLWTGPEDLSARIRSRWDDQNLYFAVEIADDDVRPDTGAAADMWKGDYVGFWLDVDLGGDFLEMVNSDDDLQIGFRPGATGSDAHSECHIWEPFSDPANVSMIEYRFTIDDRGYVLEVRLPYVVLFNDRTVPFSDTSVDIPSRNDSGRTVGLNRSDVSSDTVFHNGLKMGINVEIGDLDGELVSDTSTVSAAVPRIWGDPTTFGLLNFADDANSVSATVRNGLTGVEAADTAHEAAVWKPRAAANFVRYAGAKQPEKAGVGAQERVPRLHALPDYSDSATVDAAPAISEPQEMGVFQLPPNRAEISWDANHHFEPQTCKIANYTDCLVDDPDNRCHRVTFMKSDMQSFCGAFIRTAGNVSGFHSLTFLIRGAKGGESFEIGVNDEISHSREDAVFAGNINRFLPNGVTVDWQLATIPLGNFSGANLKKLVSLVFLFPDVGEGTFWIDEIRFSREPIVPGITKAGGDSFYVDKFDHGYLNLLGQETSTFNKLPSHCESSRTDQYRIGNDGNSLQLTYVKEASGWCGYYTRLNRSDDEYLDLTGYHNLAFYVRGERGGEDFEIGLADQQWSVIGDSIKAGSIRQYLANGVSKEWREAIVPLAKFPGLDISQMATVVFNFNVPGRGTIYFDDIRFTRDSRSRAHLNDID